MHGLLPVRLSGLALACLLIGAAHAAPPAWWFREETRIITPDSTPDNHAVANLGQLKFVAKQAKAYLDTKLPGGAGEDIATMVAAFGTTDNFAPVNLGQLKQVAKPFYDRLLEENINTNAMLLVHGAPTGWAFDYPWNPSTDPSVNYSVANLGQLKFVFSFDLEGIDSDEDGLPDSWELENNLNVGSRDENNNGVDDGLDDFDGDGISNMDEFAQFSDPLDPESAVNPPLIVPDFENQTELHIWTPLF